MPETASPEIKSISGKEKPILPPALEIQYLEQRDRIKQIYREVELWHGTGRYADSGAVDVLVGIVDTQEIRPHQDIWDGTLKTTKTISATKIRPYAVTYADIHLQPTEGELLFKDPRKWGGLIKRLTAPHILSLIRDARYFLHQRQEAIKWMENKTGQQIITRNGIKGKVDAWRQAANFGKLRSAIPGDYPILIGLLPNAFEPIKTAGYIGATERRTNQPIQITKINHLEVPLKYIEQTKVLLQDRGIFIPVLPREFGERYSTEFTQREIVTGEGFAKAT